MNKELETFLKSHLIEGESESESLEISNESVQPDNEREFIVPLLDEKQEKSYCEEPDRSLSMIKFNETKERETREEAEDFPGFLHIHICSLESFRTRRTSDFFSLRLDVSGQTYSTPRYRMAQPIKIGYHLEIPVTEKGVEIKIVVLHNSFSRVFRGLTLLPVREATVRLTREDILACKDCLKEHVIFWYNWNPKSIVQRLKNICFSGGVGVGPLYMLIGYISKDDVQRLGIPKPSLLPDLQYWLKIRRYAYCLFFGGYLNLRIKSESLVRRYVKWYGYKIFTFSSDTTLLETIDITSATTTCCPEDTSFKISTDGASYEFFCDTSEKYVACINAIRALFGSVPHIPMTLQSFY